MPVLPVSLTTLLQYAFFTAIAYFLAGAPFSESIFSGDGDSNANSKANTNPTRQTFSPENSDSLMNLDPELECEEHGYKVHVFNKEPLIVYIEGFLAKEEGERIVEISAPHWTPSPLYTAGTESYNPSIRNSSRAPLDPSDHTIACLAQRARSFQGWRPDVYIEKLWSQRYEESGHYMHHYDFGSTTRGGGRGVRGRVSTFMVYVDAEACTGGGTNFPRLQHPGTGEWCRFVECEDEASSTSNSSSSSASDSVGDVNAMTNAILKDGAGAPVKGVTFKAITGNAIFWENLRADGSGYEQTWHAGLPVRGGTKVGLNIWSWAVGGR